ncbi:transmembrane protein 234 homolog isoform X2 [Rhynchophorus ferrugineus]|uniref:transmembrane protein 234 homolog isoform X2 n=1 Tax=Rhynchophorus ferrugineus TaxID=354439 RepID=UPI003FCEA109
MFLKIGSLILVSALWGVTNPVIKKNSIGITNIKSESHIKQLYLDIIYLFTNSWYIIPMLINQLGSVLFFVTLQYVDLTLAIPISNSLTLFFTACADFVLYEQIPSRNA